jgi:hypothetical protein
MLPVCWLVGVLFHVLRLGFQNVGFISSIRRAPRMQMPAVSQAFERAQDLMHLRRRVDVFETSAVKSPALYGFFRPRLLLPPGMPQKFASDELRLVFLHELAHIKRQDMAANWLITVLQTLHWFNPILWLAFHRMRMDREWAADALALSCAAEGENKSYGEVIIKILAGLNEPAAVGGLVGILEHRGHIAHRIRLIAGFQRKRPSAVLAVSLLAFLVITCLTDAQTEKTPETPHHNIAPSAPAAALPAETDLKVQQSKPDLTDATQSSEANTLPQEDKSLAAATLVQDGRMLIEMGRLDEAEIKLREALKRNPENRNAFYYLGLIAEARAGMQRSYAQQAHQRRISGKDAWADVEESSNADTTREKLPAPNPWATTNLANTSPGRQLIYQKLDKIIFNDVLYDGLPLSEVVRDLNASARRLDPDKRGINIIIDPRLDLPAQPSEAAAIDPTTEEPLPARPSSELASLNDVRIRLHLSNVRLIDLVDAISKVAETPIKYSVIDYAVVFAQRRNEPEQLFTRTFKVDPHNLLQVLERIRLSPSHENRETNVAAALRSYLLESGVNFTNGRALFYKEQTGLLLARATLSELDVTEQAILKLNQAGSAPEARPPNHPDHEHSPADGALSGSQNERIRIPDQSAAKLDPAQLFTRVFKVDPDTFVDGLQSVLSTSALLIPKPEHVLDKASGTPETARGWSRSELIESIRKFFQAAGVSLPTNSIATEGALGLGKNAFTQPGKALFYNDRTGLLLVRATMEDLDTVEKAIQLLNQLPSQVSVQIQFTELTPSEAKEAGLEWLLQPSDSEPGSSTSVQVTNRDAFARDLLSDSATNASSSRPQDKPPRDGQPLSQAYARKLTPAQFEGVLQKLKELSGLDVLMAPRVTTLDGRETKIEVGGVSSVVAAPNLATPVSTGPTVDLIPFVSPDTRTMRLTVTPTLTEFLGYDDPGPFMAQSEAEGHAGQPVGTPLPARQPLPRFRVKSATITDFPLADGDTMVIAGLNEAQVLKSKVPVLADLPVLGRLFRSESTSNRKNLLIFITPTLIDPAGNRLHPR